MRILHVVPTYAPAWRYGGTIISVHGLCRSLAAAGHHVEVFTTNVDGPGILSEPVATPIGRDGVLVSYFPCEWPRRIYRSPAMQRQLAVRSGEFDVIHTHSVFLWPTWQAAKAARRFGKPYVVSPRGMLVPELIRQRGTLRKLVWLAAIERGTLRGAARLHATSQRERSDIERARASLAPIDVVANGIDEPTAIKRFPSSNQVVYVGRLSWKKNLDALVDAVVGIRDLRLKLAGPDEDGVVRALLDRAATAGAADRVQWMGLLEANARDALLDTSACLVLPSLNENFGNVVIEALARGCPVVVTPGVGAREIVEASASGFVAAGTDAVAIRTALESLLRDPAAAEAAGLRGREYVSANLSWSRIAEQMTDVYERAIEGAR